MQYTVPQFIEVESKIIGPISARQFVIILISGAICFVLFRMFSALVFVPGIFFFGGIGFLLAFGKINGQNMHYVILNFLYTLRRPRLKIWKRSEYYELQSKKVEVEEEVIVQKGAVTESRLASMSLMVDTGGVYQDQTQLPQQPMQQMNVPVDPYDTEHPTSQQ